METVTCYVRDLMDADRSALERLVGHRLDEQGQVLIQVTGSMPGRVENGPATDGLPEWFNVYEGLTDDEIDAIEKHIVRDHGSRSVD